MCGGKEKFRSPGTQGIRTISTYRHNAFINRPQSRNLNYNIGKERIYKKDDWISEFKIMSGHKKRTDTCHDNYKYFRRPVVPFLAPKTQNIEVPVRFEHDILNNAVRSAQKHCYILPPKIEPHRTVGTQTDYRDSEAQTLPWEPPCRIKPGHNPEVLTIAHLTWSHGLPAGVHEVEVINRIRMRRAWEEILPPMDTPANIKLRTSIISALEIDEWAFRESEIQAIMDYRLRLMDEISETHECEHQEKVQGRFGRLRDTLGKRRDREINSVRSQLRRELRKLHKKRQATLRPSKRDVIREHADPSSEMYAPLMRLGEHPQRRHEVIRKELLKDAYVERAAMIDTTPNWLPTYEELRAIKPKPKPTDLCIRETRWTEEKLKQLHSDLKAIRLNLKPTETSSLMRRKYRPPALPSTPCRSNAENSEGTEIDRFSTFIQKTVRGRAIQCMMFEGRDRCRELIEELQSTHALEERNKVKRYEEKMQMIELQRLQNDRTIQEDRVCEILNSLEGMTVSAMLDFLSKELIRLEDERRVHAFALLAERERCMREAAEAGRRQLERTRRREFDEMFRQIIKVHQDSVETYLEDVIKEGIEWASEEAAKEYILELSDKVDRASKYAAENASELEQEEMVANMVYNFVLPEVEKRTVRKNIRENQQNYLRNAHRVIYEQILDLPPVEDLTLFDGEAEKKLADEDVIDEEGVDANLTPEVESDFSVVAESPKDVESLSEPTETDIVSAESIEVIHNLLDCVISEVVGRGGSSPERSRSFSSNNEFYD